MELLWLEALDLDTTIVVVSLMIMGAMTILHLAEVQVDLAMVLLVDLEDQVAMVVVMAIEAMGMAQEDPQEDHRPLLMTIRAVIATTPPLRTVVCGGAEAEARDQVIKG